jgi:alkanesulfonate monooxygenase SsuD/methylene tetrahydromethanopterin reductase-like flavin-dependent oxidoreductase (luciferase family)
LPPPVENYTETLDPLARSMIAQALSCTIVGTPETVRRDLEAFVRRTGADELMITSQAFDHTARKRSFEILAEAHQQLANAA